MRELLRPKPFRGDVVAAGVVVLVTLAGLLTVRFADAWGPGAHLAYAAVACAFVAAMAVLSPMERAVPRAYQSVLYVATLALTLLTLGWLARVLGDHDVGDTGTGWWVLALLSAAALAFATRRNSAVCTLLGALSGAGAVLALCDELFDPDDAATFRWLLLVLVAVLGLGAVAQRDRRRRHAVALVDAAGAACLALALTFAPGLLVLEGGERAAAVGWGWTLVVVAVGFGLIAYSSVDREPGPAYFGVLNLAAFIVLAARGDATLIGWPIVLAGAATALLVIGLRPTTPAPPPPPDLRAGADAEPPPPLPLR